MKSLINKVILSLMVTGLFAACSSKDIPSYEKERLKLEKRKQTEQRMDKLYNELDRDVK